MENNDIVIYHHGVKGQKWGIRRFQNKDGSLTRLGKKRLNQSEKEQLKKQKEADKAKKKAASAEAAKKKAEEAAKKKAADEEAAKQKKAEDLAKKKSDVVKARSAKEFYENRKMFTYDETKKMRELLQEDKLIKSMIEEKPNKLKKFLTEAGDYTKKINDVVVPAASIIKNAKSIYDTLNGKADSSKGNDQNKNKDSGSNKKESIDYKSLFEKTKQTMKESAKGKGTDSQEFKNWTNTVLSEDLAIFNSKNFDSSYDAGKAAVNKLLDEDD